MSIIQFYRILWARRMLIVATTISCLIGGFILTRVLPPRYESHARVMLGLLKPDPVTGQLFGGASAGAYVGTQIELVTDYSVAGQVADALGWPSDPNLIAAYNRRSKKDHRDFHHWVAQRVTDGVKAKLLEGSNILEITYTASDPQTAQQVAEVVQKAYLDTSLSMRREDATRSADWFEQQAEKTKTDLNGAEDALAQYERANGVMMRDDKQDLESARLDELSQQGMTTVPTVPPPIQSTASAMELAQVDAQIAQQSKILGPNHPDLQALKLRRAALAELVSKDQAAQRATFGAIAGANAAGASALRGEIEAQKSRVIAQSDKLEHLKQLQADVDQKRAQYDKLTAGAAELRQQAAAVETGLSVLGRASTPSAPSFPNMLLIVPGSTLLGFALGTLVAILSELLSRRVRGIEDLRSVTGVNVIAVIPSATPKQPTANNRFGALQTFFTSLTRRRRMAPV
jgi:polysaccharide biosynthesis transport protein